MKPAISVIVPFYNIEQYVSYCLDSILAQTFRDFELICINDGSKDGTRELLDAYAEKDPRVKVIHQENQGLSAARNNGLQFAAGKYIAFINGDDAVTPEYLEILYSEAEKSGADFAFCDYAKTEADQRSVPEPCREHPADIIQDSIIHSQLSKKIRLPVFAWAKLFRRDFLADAPFVPGVYFEDYLFFYTSLFRLKKVCRIKALMYLYTQTPNSIMHSPFSIKKAKSYLVIYDQMMKLEDRLSSPEDKKLFHRKAAGQLRSILSGLYDLNKEDLKEILPLIQDHFSRWHADGKLPLHDFRLKYRFLLLMLIKRWNKCLFSLFELDVKTGGWVRNSIRRKRLRELQR